MFEDKIPTPQPTLPNPVINPTEMDFKQTESLETLRNALENFIFILPNFSVNGQAGMRQSPNLTEKGGDGIGKESIKNKSKQTKKTKTKTNRSPKRTRTAEQQG